MLSSKHLFIFTLFALGTGARADTLDGDGILRDDQGAVRLVKHSEALTACPQGTHLPTIRELTSLAKAQGSKILELAEVQGEPPFGYHLVEATNPDGKIDRFYYNSYGYRRPDGEALRRNGFWSTSLSMNPIYAFEFSGDIGYPYSVHRGQFDFAVRCLAGP
jgi:hypothetical protein